MIQFIFFLIKLQVYNVHPLPHSITGSCVRISDLFFDELGEDIGNFVPHLVHILLYCILGITPLFLQFVLHHHLTLKIQNKPQYIKYSIISIKTIRGQCSWILWVSLIHSHKFTSPKQTYKNLNCLQCVMKQTLCPQEPVKLLLFINLDPHNLK